MDTTFAPTTRGFVRRHWRLVTAGAALLVVLVAGLAWLITRDTWRYDEPMHREMIDAVYGSDHVTDWPAYRDAWLDICTDQQDLGLLTAVFVDGGTPASEVELNIKMTCPDRLDEIPDRWRILN